MKVKSEPTPGDKGYETWLLKRVSNYSTLSAAYEVKALKLTRKAERINKKLANIASEIKKYDPADLIVRLWNKAPNSRDKKSVKAFNKNMKLLKTYAIKHDSLAEEGARIEKEFEGIVTDAEQFCTEQEDKIVKFVEAIGDKEPTEEAQRGLDAIKSMIAEMRNLKKETT